MARYVWNGHAFVERQTGERMVVPERSEIQCPQVMRDIDEYRSPINGALITSRSHRREDLKRNDCVEAPPRKQREYRNPKYRQAKGN